MQGKRFVSAVGRLAVVAMVVGGCTASPTAAGAMAPTVPATDRQTVAPAAAPAGRRGLPETTAAVTAWLAFEASSRIAERQEVPSVGGGTSAMAPVAAPALAPVAAPVAASDGPQVAPAAGGVVNADGTVTLTQSREGTRSEGPYTETLTLTYQEATRRPVTYRHRLTVTQDGRTLVSQSRSKVWLPDGRFTESVSLTGYGPASAGTPAPWRIDATTQSAADGTETTVGTLRRSDGSTLTLRRTRSGQGTSLEVTDSRQSLTLSGRAADGDEVRALTVVIDGRTGDTIELPSAG